MEDLCTLIMVSSGMDLFIMWLDHVGSPVTSNTNRQIQRNFIPSKASLDGFQMLVLRHVLNNIETQNSSFCKRPNIKGALCSQIPPPYSIVACYRVMLWSHEEYDFVFVQDESSGCKRKIGESTPICKHTIFYIQRVDYLIGKFQQIPVHGILWLQYLITTMSQLETQLTGL